MKRARMVLVLALVLSGPLAFQGVAMSAGTTSQGTTSGTQSDQDDQMRKGVGSNPSTSGPGCTTTNQGGVTPGTGTTSGSGTGSTTGGGTMVGTSTGSGGTTSGSGGTSSGSGGSSCGQ